MINTHCRPSHSPYDLSCKLGKEFDGFIESGRKWWCHLDDDVYVHVDNLLDFLANEDWQKDMYVGRTVRPGEVFVMYHGVKYGVKYVTGAAACISKTTAEKIQPLAGSGGIHKVGTMHAFDQLLRS